MDTFIYDFFGWLGLFVQLALLVLVFAFLIGVVRLIWRKGNKKQ